MNNWTRVEDDTPPYDVDILVRMLSSDGTAEYRVAKYEYYEYRDRSVFMDGPYFLNDVTHWMKMPEWMPRSEPPND